MARNEIWSREEVRATVADYLDMLRQELAGAPFSKAAHRRELSARLDVRSGPSIEFPRAVSILIRQVDSSESQE